MAVSLTLGGVAVAQPQAGLTIKGVTFEPPAGLSVQPEPGQWEASWANAEQTISVMLAAMPLADDQALDAARELRDWPAVGRSLADGFGRKNAERLGAELGAPCRFVGMPQARDGTRAMIQCQVDTTCERASSAFTLRSRLVQVVTRSHSLLFRIDSQSPSDAQAAAITSKLWQSIRIDEGHRIVVENSSEDGNPPTATARPVTGGTGIRLRDYGLIRPAWLVGEFVGGVVAGLILGALATAVLLKFGVGLLPALIGPQVLFCLVRMLAGTQSYPKEIDPIGSAVVGAVVVAALYPWAKGRSARNRSRKGRDATGGVKE